MGDTKFTLLEIEQSECTHLIPNDIKGKNLSWQLAILFVVGEVLGGGVIAIGDALVNTGWGGVLIIVAAVIANVHIASVLAECVSMSNTKQTRDPYARTVLLAFGAKGKTIVSIIFYILVICVTTVYLIISSELLVMVLSEVFPSLQNSYQLRIWLCVTALILIPVTWLGTPSDSWGVALFAVVTTIIAAVLISTSILLKAPQDLSKVTERRVTPLTFFRGLGTIFFGFCGIPFFPNIQNDMKNEEEFLKSSIISYIIIGLVYLPVAILGMVLLGDNIEANVIYNALMVPNNLNSSMKHTTRWLAYTSIILLAGHFIFAYSLIFNSMAQEIEERFKIENRFCWQRCLIRTSIVLLTLTVAQSIPRFDIIISLIGGALQTPLSYHVPAIVYCKLHSDVSKTKKLVIAAIVSFGSIVCVGSVYANIVALIEFYKN